MKLSIVVLNYKSKNLVKYFLKNVENFIFDFSWEVVVVDNNSHDGIGHVIEHEFPKVNFISSKKNRGMGAGNNLGIRESGGQYVLVANPDITLNTDSVKKMIDFLDNHPRADLIGPRVNNPDGTRQESCFRFPEFFTFLYRRTFLGRTEYGKKSLENYHYKSSDLEKPTKVDWVLGGCFMARRSVLSSVGCFDERFFLFLEDTDICRSIWQSGGEVWYFPDATAIHLPHRLSSGRGSISDIFARLTWVHFFSWLKYFWKWRSFR